MTRFFLRMRGLGGFNFMRLLTLAAGQILTLSFAFFLPPVSASLQLFYFWTCSLNGVLLVNPFTQVFVGDIVQAFNFYLPPHFLGSSFSRIYFSGYLKRQFLRGFELRRTNDVPGYLEVDELVLSAVILYEPTLIPLLSTALTGPAPFLTFRLYNWKYVT